MGGCSIGAKMGDAEAITLEMHRALRPGSGPFGPGALSVQEYQQARRQLLLDELGMSKEEMSQR
jgi:hypothetical protein